jgi:hypothetical protein
MALKVMLISILVFIVLFIILRATYKTLSIEDQIRTHLNNPPKQMLILGLLLVISFAETILSVFVWIVTL